MVEAEEGAGERGRLATVAAGPDVTADGVLVGLGVHGVPRSGLNAEGRKRRPRGADGLAALLFYLYLYYMGLGETSMPSIFMVEVIDGMWIRGILRGRGA